MLGAICYHCEAGTEGEKRLMLRDLVMSRQQVFVAISALGLGVGHSTIRADLFFGLI
jgi:hypothetical protein